MQPLTLIKIGGSLISDKSRPFSIRAEQLQKIAEQIAEIASMQVPILVAHGAGSFGHAPAKKYQTHLGFINEESRLGLTEVAAATRAFNKIVMEALHRAGVLAVSVSPLSYLTGRNHRLGAVNTRPIELLLQQGMVPVVFGDPVLDEVVGCTVFSAEKVLAYTGLELRNKGIPIKKIVHCSHVGGVFAADGSLIDTITPQNFASFASVISGSDGIDVSGGMQQKVKETLELASQGIPGLIIDGIKSSLVDAVLDKTVRGTRVEFE